MRLLIAICLLISLNASAAPAQPSLIGVWKSDRALTMKFAEKNNRLLPKTEHFWSEMVGRLTLTITSNSIRQELPDWDVDIEGKTHHMVGFSNSSPYKITYSGPDAAVIVAKNPVTLASEPTTYNFVDTDTFWIYSGRGNDESPGSHLREYFKRVGQ